MRETLMIKGFSADLSAKCLGLGTPVVLGKTMDRIDLRLFGIALALTAVLLPAADAADEPKHDFEVVNASAIYYGRAKHPKTPAQCRADDVWAQIPEYKKILDEELTDNDPRYHLLLKRATKRFQSALKKLAKRDSYDVIGEIGSIKAVGKKKKAIPSVTKALIDLVTRD